jgi:superfamily II DNA/RNA helicase
MANTLQQNILKKLNIEQLNPMQRDAHKIINKKENTLILSPTGSGKTLAFLLPILEKLDPQLNEIQCLIMVPSRELAIQIEQVTRNMGSGFKVNAVYGGRTGAKDKLELKQRPAVLIGTPGRIASHFRKESFDNQHIKTLVLDEFDKSLEVGFEEDMKDIINEIPNINKRVLTSATYGVKIPDFVEFTDASTLNYLKEEAASQLAIKTINSPTKDKLETLVNTLCFLGNQPGIVFCNFKDTIQEISDYLRKNGINHGCFHGGMEQIDREKTLLKFRNGTHQVIIATDLASRGLDIPELKYIIHFELPHRSEEFTHRNGRTARMNSEGTAYVLKWENQSLPEFITKSPIEKIEKSALPTPSEWETLFITGGRKDKISKGDIAGLFCKQGNLSNDEIGIIELQVNCSYVAVKASKIDQLLPLVHNTRLKKKKVRITKV